MKIRPSSLGKIMTSPRSKSETLSEGAKSHINDLAKQHVYGYRTNLSGVREVQKGLIVENDSIALLNDVLFTSYAKNEERRYNDFLTGECDVFTGSKIHDVKSSWSIATFPALPSEGANPIYEWQLRAYMMLWDVDHAELDYCLVDTPDELIGYEDESLHKVSHLAPTLRVTRIEYSRDRGMEEQIKTKCEAAQVYFYQTVDAILAVHQ